MTSTSAIPYNERPEWSDVTPIPQDDGPNAVVQIAYMSEYSNAMDYFRAISFKDEISERALELTSHIVQLNPGHYTIWHYRSKVLFDLKKDLKEEIQFINTMLEEHPKNYQIWHHRQLIIEKLNDPSGELEFVKLILGEDSKNYHAWSYRQWLLTTFQLFSEELAFINDLLQFDLRNNSAWNQRYFVLTQGPDSIKLNTAERMKEEVSYVLKYIKRAPNNESPWAYLRGILRAHSYQLSSFPEIEQICDDLILNKVSSPHLFSFMMDLYLEKNMKDRAVELCTHLEETVDTIRAQYWKFRRHQIINGQK